ncbi:hypothetical protein V2J09_018136 [Rumex salicifolius]
MFILCTSGRRPSKYAVAALYCYSEGNYECNPTSTSLAEQSIDKTKPAELSHTGSDADGESNQVTEIKESEVTQPSDVMHDSNELEPKRNLLDNQVCKKAFIQLFTQFIEPMFILECQGDMHELLFLYYNIRSLIKKQHT